MRSYTIDRMEITPHRFTVPLDWNATDDSQALTISAHEVVASELRHANLPVLCWFQYGPGFAHGLPTSRSGWLGSLLERYRVVLLEQRGTGYGSTIDPSGHSFETPQQFAGYLTHFRADSIVRDAEHVRQSLLGGRKWAIAGQSFGGFCCLTYLSFFPNALDDVIITGGFAPVLRTPDEVYRSLTERTAVANVRFRTQFPESQQHIRAILDHLNAESFRTDSVTSDRQFLTLGLYLGYASGAARVNTVVEQLAFQLREHGYLTWAGYNAISDVLDLSSHPLYGVLHEAIYCDGTSSMWAADRQTHADRRFSSAGRTPPFFTGEMVFPWMFEEIPALRPMREVANLLAAKEDWSRLYDPDRLRDNAVPVVGTIYYDDLYVDCDYAVETAGLVGNCRPWITNEYLHGAFNIDSGRIYNRLFEMLDDIGKPPVRRIA